MKKSQPIPKQLAKKRIAKLLMKINKDEGNFDHKENLPQFNIRHNPVIIHDRVVEDGPPCPFNIPNILGLFPPRENIGKGETSRRKTGVKSEPFIMSEPHTISDIYPLFYGIIEGRPIRHFVDVKVYIKNIRDITLLKADIAYLNDQIIHIDASQRKEVIEYNKIFKLNKGINACFVNFIKQSYKLALASECAAEEVAKNLSEMSERLETYSFDYCVLKNKISSLQATFDTLFIYAKFLNGVGPSRRMLLLGDLNQQDSNSSIVSFKSVDTLPISTSIGEVFLHSEMEFHPKPKAHLCFKDPQELMDVLDDIRKQSLHYLEIDALSSNICKSINKSLQRMQHLTAKEVAEAQEHIEFYENKIKFLEEKTENYRSLFDKILNGEFKTLFASYDTVKLFTCLQFVNIQIFQNYEDPKDSLTMLMHDLEALYMELSLNIDCLSPKIVKSISNQLYREDIKMIKDAYKAQRNLKECDILFKMLHKSYEPPKIIRK